MNLNFSHQARIFDPRFVKPTTIIGIGAVGSKVALGLVCVGVTDLTVWDPDFVASHNPAMSAYRFNDNGLKKCAALAQIIEEKSGVGIKQQPRAYEGERLRHSIVASVDTMEARSCIWKAVRNNPLIDIFIDTRVSQLMSSVFAIRPCDPEDIAYYEHFLYPSAEAKRQTCGVHGIAYATDTVAARACHQLTSFWSTGSIVRHQYEGFGAIPYLSLSGVTQ